MGKRWSEVTLEDLKFAYLNTKLSLDQALDAASELNRTGLPYEYYDALGVTHGVTE